MKCQNCHCNSISSFNSIPVRKRRFNIACKVFKKEVNTLYLLVWLYICSLQLIVSCYLLLELIQVFCERILCACAVVIKYLFIYFRHLIPFITTLTVERWQEMRGLRHEEWYNATKVPGWTWTEDVAIHGRCLEPFPKENHFIFLFLSWSEGMYIDLQGQKLCINKDQILYMQYSPQKVNGQFDEWASHFIILIFGIWYSADVNFCPCELWVCGCVFLASLQKRKE